MGDPSPVGDWGFRGFGGEGGPVGGGVVQELLY